MKVLKTIVATAAIVFAGTTVATAAVNHFSGSPNPQPVATHQASAAQPVFTINMTAKQLTRLAQMMNGNQGHKQSAHQATIARTNRAASHATYTVRTTTRHARSTHATRSYSGYRCRWYGSSRSSGSSHSSYRGGSSHSSSHGSSGGCGGGCW